MPKATDRYNLAVVHPEIAAQWHPRKNGALTPQAITPGSGRKVWWRCRKGHAWQAAVYSRVKGSGCPHCYRASVVRGRPIVGSRLLAEWHPTLNKGLNPRSLTTAYNRAVWWLCRSGHEWKATLRRRLKGEGCPQCLPESVSEDQPKTAEAVAKKPARQRPAMWLLAEESGLGSESYTDTNFRKEKRFTHRASVMIEIPRGGYLLYALLKDYSARGMSIETDDPLGPGTRIIIRLNENFTAAGAEPIKSIVRWCKELTDANGSMVGYNVGVEFI